MPSGCVGVLNDMCMIRQSNGRMMIGLVQHAKNFGRLSETQSWQA